MTHSPEVEVAFEGDGVVKDYIAKFSDWGRWGADDELGALNHVGPEQVVAAARLVRQGKVISMSLPYDLHGPQSGSFRANPLNVTTATGTDYMMGAQNELPAGFGAAKGFGFADDVLLTPNQAGTQWDALAHIFWRGRMYNGYPAAEVTAQGAQRCGVENHSQMFVMRGVLLDVARHDGVDSLEPGYAITAGDLDRTAESQGVEAPWLYEHDIAAIATDTWGCEVRPNEVELFQPLHIVALVHMGIPFGEIWDLEAIGIDCAEDGVYEFQLCAPPLPITGAAGSPVNALAVK